MVRVKYVVNVTDPTILIADDIMSSVKATPDDLEAELNERINLSPEDLMATKSYKTKWDLRPADWTTKDDVMAG
jgi:hypothetical protein